MIISLANTDNNIKTSDKSAETGLGGLVRKQEADKKRVIAR
jgi:hypothetical protein